ncbi:MAG: hypothetical protein ABUK01_18895 [Leptospirales bacterium]
MSIKIIYVMTIIILVVTCQKEKDLNPFLKNIYIYANKKCLKKDNCIIPKELFFVNKNYDRIIVTADINDEMDNRKILGLNIEIEGGSRGYQIWFFMKGNTLYRYFKNDLAQFSFKNYGPKIQMYMDENVEYIKITKNDIVYASDLLIENKNRSEFRMYKK